MNGFTHYSSNLLSGGHIIAGVKKAIHLGILSDTYGYTMIDDKDPYNASGTGIVTTIDYKVFVWTRMLPIVFNVTLV